MSTKICVVWDGDIRTPDAETLPVEDHVLKDWECLEIHVCNLLDEAGHLAERTPGSGSKRRNDSDVHTRRFQLECKLKNTEGFSITKEAWNKLVYRAGMRAKVPILVTGNAKDISEAVIVMRLRDFVGILPSEDEL